MIAGQKFLGCCGVVTWYLNDASENYIFNYMKDRANSDKNSYSLALVILNTEQKTALHKGMLKFGFRKVCGPIRNRNTDCGLNLYVLNLNTYRSKTSKRVTKRRFW